ncbi:MAG TPA: hypothetical protein VE967_07455 [Gemmatimonadaceae bacterium]|nr:hypothetical protein [Gemmatimonadaceae bacterium]
MHHRPILAAFALWGATLAVPSHAARAQTAADSAEFVNVLAAAFEEVHSMYPFGRVLVERTVIDTTKRSAPPLMSGRTHPVPERWARGVEVELVTPEMTSPVCHSGTVDCDLPNGVAGVVAFSDPIVRGDSARVTVRYSRNTPAGVGHVSTYVETLSLVKHDGEWKVLKRKKAPAIR